MTYSPAEIDQAIDTLRAGRRAGEDWTVGGVLHRASEEEDQRLFDAWYGNAAPRGIYESEPPEQPTGLWLEPSDRPFVIRARLSRDDPYCEDIHVETLWDHMSMVSNLDILMSLVRVRLTLSRARDYKKLPSEQWVCREGHVNSLLMHAYCHECAGPRPKYVNPYARGGVFDRT